MKDTYAEKSISQIPRILSLQDRNEFSSTYGCFDREYWLCRTTDFPSAIAQYSTHSLALVYSYAFPDNIYYRQKKILQWILAGMEYWTKIQKSDGSFDEFYPNERGWAGPTGFLLYAMLDCYRILGRQIPDELEDRLLKAAHKAARYLSKYDEAGVLANHHAVAALSVYEAYLATGERDLLKGYRRKLDEFLSYVSPEGWALEYDGADLGYLSATVSFLGKLYKVYQDDYMREELFEVLKRAIVFSSYFIYPNGFYGGTIGSRQTLHFYPHGYEILSDKVSLAGAVADKMLLSLRDGKLVPPEIMGDRYFVYRVPEFLQAYQDYKPRNNSLPGVPYEREPFSTYFEEAKMYLKKTRDYYLVVNASKGGIIKLFDLSSSELVLNDCGVIAELNDGRIISTQWIDENHEITVGDEKIMVKGSFHFVPFLVFSPLKMIIFRLGLMLLGWSTKLSYRIKWNIRKMLMLKYGSARIRFERSMVMSDKSLKVEDEIKAGKGIVFKRVKIGGEFSIRYVPQSRYFQTQELNIEEYELTPDEIDKINEEGRFKTERTVIPQVKMCKQ